MHSYRFDLDKAIAAWRAGLQIRRAFNPDDLDELEQHLREQVTAAVAEGADDEAAFRRAVEEMGDYTTAEIEYRKVYWGKLRRRREVLRELYWRLSMLNSYIRIALRNMRKQKLYSFINVFGLGVGIACCLLIALYVLHESSYDRFHEKADRIYRLAYDARLGTDLPPAAPDEYLIWGSAVHAPLLEADFPEIEHAVRLSGRHEILLTHEDQSFQESRYFFADPAFFDVFSFPLLRGDPSTVLARPQTIVLSASAAARYFGDEDPVGQTIRLESGEGRGDLEVTGLMADPPVNTHLDFDILISMSTFEQQARSSGQDYKFDAAGYVDFFTYVLLRDGEAADAIQAKLHDFVERHFSIGSLDPPRTYALALEPLMEAYHSPAGRRQPRLAGSTGNPANLYLFSFIGLFILVIACFNFMNLATALSVNRAREVGVRKSVGARRSGLIWQFLSEALFLTALATMIALLLAKLALPLFRTLAGKDVSAVPLTEPMLLISLVLGALVVGLLAGSYPAVVLSRFRPSHVLKGDFKTSAGGARLRRTFVVLQFTAAIALIVGTVVVRAQLDYLRERPLGFDDKQQLVLDFGGDPQVRSEIETIKQEMTAIRGVESAAATRSVPGGYFPGAGSRLEAPDGTMQIVELGLFEVDPEFLAQLGVGIAAGRHFDRALATDADQALILNEAAARELGYANPADAVGRRFAQWGREGEIVGIVRDFNHESLHHMIAPLSFRVAPWLRFLVLQISTEDASRVVADVRERWGDLAPHRPFLYSFLDQSFDALYRSEDRFGALFGTFAALAIFIACLGLFGLAAFSVQQRTKEIGIRKVLGASVTGIVALLSRDFLKLVGISLLIAFPLAYFGMSRWLEDFAYRVDIGPGIFLLTAALVLLIAVLTVSYQAIRAAVADPVRSLRYE